MDRLDLAAWLYPRRRPREPEPLKTTGWFQRTGWKPWPERIKNFTPAWFAVTMGTGALPLLLTLLPYPPLPSALRPLSLLLYFLNITLLLFFLLLSTLRYLRHPSLLPLMLSHPTQALFLGTVPMGISTVVSGGCLLFPAARRYHVFLLALWWLHVALALATAVGLVFYAMRRYNYTTGSANATLLLPIVPLVVGASAGTGLVPLFPGVWGAAVLSACFMMWSAGMGLSALVLGWYLWRLLSVGLPGREVVITSFLPIGPLGQGAFGIVRMGALRGGLAQELAVFVAWALLSNGVFWIVLAVASVLVNRPSQFNLGWWGAVFPLATWALGAGALGAAGEGEGWKGAGAGMTIVVVLVWLVCMAGTVWKGFWLGEMFHAPCLAGWMENGPREGMVEEGGLGEGREK